MKVCLMQTSDKIIAVSPTTVDKCIIYQEIKTIKSLLKRNRVPEKLTQCQTFRSGKTLLSAAEKRGDMHIVVQLKNQDVIALEIKYHKSCFTK